MKGNKTSKILVPILMASIAGTMVTANARDFNVYANPTNLLGAEISVSGFKSTGKVGVDYTLPTVTLSDSSFDLVRELVDPRGAVLKNVTNVFKPSHSGTYTLKYKAVKDGAITTTTETMKIEVSKSDYAINLPTNSPYVLLDTVKTGTTLRIPVPELTVDGEVESDLNKLNVIVTAEDNTTTEFTNSNVKTDSNGVKYFEYVPSTNGVYDIEYRFEENHVCQAIKSQRFIAKESFDYSNIKLSMSYSSTKPTSAIIGKEVELPKVSVKDTNNGSQAISAYVDVKVYYRGTSANRLATPEEVEVKDYKFTPNKEGDYSVTYQARISYFDGQTEHKIETAKSTFEISDVKDSEAPTPMVVNSYKVDENGKITHIADSYTQDATGKVTENFVALSGDETEEEIMELLGSRANAIPSVVVIPNGKTEVRVAIPAIYGKDNAVDGTALTYTRSVRYTDSGSQTTVNKNFEDTETVSAGEITYYTFKDATTYTFRFKAADSDKDTTNYDILSYTVKVVHENDFKAGTPVVTMESFSEYVYNDTTLTFAKPSATDTKTDYVDNRLNIATTYHFVKSSGATTTPVEITETNDNGKYELNLEEIIRDLVANDDTINDASELTNIVLTAKTTNDGGVEGKVVRNIALINTIDDKTPIITSDGNDFADAIASLNSVTDSRSFKQRDKVFLPDMNFEDNHGSVLTSSVVVTDPNGSKVNVYNSQSVNDDDGSISSVTIKDGYFTADYAGVYQIKYTVKDSGGNAVYATYGIEVQLSETPTLYLANISDFENKEYQLGTEIFPPKAGLYLNGKYMTPDDSTDDLTINTSWTIAPAVWDDSFLPSGLTPEEQKEYKENWELENRIQTPEITQVNGKNVSFKATVAGVYTIRYTGSYTNSTGTTVVEDERIVKITVKDLTKPVITILENEYKTFPIYEKEYVANKEVIIPGFVVTESYDLDSVKRSVEVTGYDGKSITPKYIKALEEYTESEIEAEVKAANPQGEMESGAWETLIDEKIVEFKKYHTDYAGMYSFIPNGNGTHTVYYVAVDGNGNEVKSDGQKVYIGDCDNPVLDFGSTSVQNTVIPTSVKVGTTYELNMSELVKYCSDNKSEIEDGTLKVTAVLRNASGTKQENLFGSSSDVNRYKWTLNETGNYTLYITLTDKAGKTTTKEFTIKSTAKESKETKVTEVVGIILIVLSLAVLAGVIVYFVVTGRKMRPGSSKKAKRSSKK